MVKLKKCPWCAEEIPEEALRCRYCRSRVTSLDPERWHRNVPERRLAGVAAATARGLAVPVILVRLAFLVLTFFHLLGPILYGALWLLIPFEADGEPPLACGIERIRNAVAAFRRNPRPGGGPTGSSRSTEVRGDLLP